MRYFQYRNDVSFIKKRQIDRKPLWNAEYQDIEIASSPFHATVNLSNHWFEFTNYIRPDGFSMLFSITG